MLIPIVLFVGANGAQAQPFLGGHLAPVSSDAPAVGIFARYTLQPPLARQQEAWQVGLAFSQPNRSSRFSYAEPLTPALEVRFGKQNFGLWSAGTNGSLIAGLHSRQITLSANQATSGQMSGLSRGLLIGGAIVGGIVLLAALSPDKKPLLCTGNTVPNPIAGTCEPIR
jgi:hypothetical protein